MTLRSWNLGGLASFVPLITILIWNPVNCIDELEQFTGFQVKIVMSGTNEARPPRFRDLRVIALA